MELTVAHASRTPATLAEKDDKEHTRQHWLRGADTARTAPGGPAGVMLNSCQVQKHAAQDDTAGKDLKLKEKTMLHITYGYKHSRKYEPSNRKEVYKLQNSKLSLKKEEE